MGAGMLASPDANRVQTICWYVRRAAVCSGQGDAASITTQSMAGKYCAQRPKSVDDFTVFQANTIDRKLHQEPRGSLTQEILAKDFTGRGPRAPTSR
jgi:hypothetical protein